ncbi:MAG: RHS repeat-associated core domain-containing protein [archaeon]
MKKTLTTIILVMIFVVISGIVISAEQFRINTKPITEAKEDVLYTYDVDVYIPGNNIDGDILIVPKAGLDLPELNITDNETINITINQTNETEIETNTTINITENVTINITEYPEHEPIPNNYKIKFGLLESPKKMRINPKTGVIKWTPENEDALPGQNNHKVIVEAQDTEGRSDTQTFTITVENINDAPKIKDFPEIIFSKEIPLIINLNKYVEDIDDPVEELNWEIIGNEKILINIDENNIATFSTDTYWYGKELLIINVFDSELEDEKKKEMIVEKTLPQAPLGEGMPISEESESISIPQTLPRLGGIVTQDINLVSGWNLFSLAVVPEDQSVESILTPINDRYISVKALVYTPNGTEWKYYVPEWPAEDNTLTYLDETMGIYIEIYPSLPAPSIILPVEGQEVESTTIELDKGWNLIGFPSMTNQDVVFALENLEPHMISIWEYEPRIDPEWFHYNPSVPPFVNTLEELHSGYAYWIHSNVRMRIHFEDGSYNIEEVDSTQKPGEYVYISVGSDRLIKIDKETDEESYYHYDRLGNTRIVTNEAGETTWKEDYYPFGSQLDSEGDDNSFGFGAKEYDYDTKLSDFVARSYSSELGRFIQVDPLFKPEKSAYAFGNNNPLRFGDPTGMSEEEYRNPDLDLRDHSSLKDFSGGLTPPAEGVVPNPFGGQGEEVIVYLPGFNTPGWSEIVEHTIDDIHKETGVEYRNIHDFYYFDGSGLKVLGVSLKDLYKMWGLMVTDKSVVPQAYIDQGLPLAMSKATTVLTHSGGTTAGSKFAPPGAEVRTMNGAPTFNQENGDSVVQITKSVISSGDGVGGLISPFFDEDCYVPIGKSEVEGSHGTRSEYTAAAFNDDYEHSTTLEGRFGLASIKDDPYTPENEALNGVRIGYFIRGVNFPG